MKSPLIVLPRLVRKSLLILAVVAGSFHATYAATYTVTKNADSNDGICDADCSLREAISAANASGLDDEIQFAALFDTTQTITLSGTELLILPRGRLSIIGSAFALTTVAANSLSRVLKVSSGAVVMVSHIKVTSGRLLNGSGAGINNSGSLTLNNCTVQGNKVDNDNGGGIFNDGTESKLILNSSVVTGNTGNGGGIYNFEGEVDLNSSDVSSNIGINGAGILSNGGHFKIHDSMINFNSAGNGGGIGGGILSYRSDLRISDSVINGNSATSSGGGLFNDQGVFFISGTRISNNRSSASGGGVSSTSGNGTLNGVSMIGNEACGSCQGGAVLFTGTSQSHTLNISNSNFLSNRAGVGAGIHTGYAATANIQTSLIANNNAQFGGGGIFVDGGNLSLTNSTVWGNSTTDRFGGGGGIDLGSATVTLTNVTVVENSTEGDRGGGGILNGSGTAFGTINLQSSLIGDNRANRSPNHDVSGNFISQGYNLIENRSGAAISGVQTGNIFDRDPQLAYIADNGGPTQSVALLGTSPAIDAGHPTNAPLFDQRGIARPTDGNLDGVSLTDIGAYERQITQFVVTKVADTSDGACDSDCSLREALGAAGTQPGSDTVVTFQPQTFAEPQTITLNQGELTIPEAGTLTIFGSGRDRLTIDGNSQTRVLLNTGSGAVRSLRITGGRKLDGSGGGIFNVRRLSLEDVSVTENEASYGGGGIGTGVTGSSHLILIRSSVDNNRETGTSLGLDGGGGIDNEGGLTIEDSIISNNVTNSRGGGVRSDYSAFVAIRRSTIHDNTAFEGGGIYYTTNNPGSGLIIVNSTLSKNIAQHDGGGIYSPSLTTIINSTISFNIANADGFGTGQGGGINTSSNSMLSLRNTLVSDNFDNGLSPDIAGSVSSKGFNLIENTNGTTITGETVGNILRQDPMLDPRLLFNGGPTPTHALRLDSPVIDKGSIVTPGLTTDQRGRPRPYDFPSILDASGGNGSDIGAFERQGTDVSGLEYASISGRVFTPSGQGLRNSVVTLIYANGTRRNATTSSFGVFSFSGVPTGSTYTIIVSSKRYRFAPTVQEINDNLVNLDLVGLE